MSNNTNNGPATAAMLGHQRQDSHCCPHMDDESSHMAGWAK